MKSDKGPTIEAEHTIGQPIPCSASLRRQVQQLREYISELFPILNAVLGKVILA
jgi:hypothetical protein